MSDPPPSCTLWVPPWGMLIPKNVMHHTFCKMIFNDLQFIISFWKTDWCKRSSLCYLFSLGRWVGILISTCSLASREWLFSPNWGAGIVWYWEYSPTTTVLEVWIQELTWHVGLSFSLIFVLGSPLFLAGFSSLLSSSKIDISKCQIDLKFEGHRFAICKMANKCWLAFKSIYLFTLTESRSLTPKAFGLLLSSFPQAYCHQ